MTDKPAAPILIFQRREGRDIEDEKAALRAEAADYDIDEATCERVISTAYLADWLTSLSVQILRARCQQEPSPEAVVALVTEMLRNI